MVNGQETIKRTPIPRQIVSRPGEVLVGGPGGITSVPLTPQETQRLRSGQLGLTPTIRRRGERVRELSIEQQRLQAERIQRETLSRERATALQIQREQERQIGIQSRRLAGQFDTGTIISEPPGIPEGAFIPRPERREPPDRPPGFLTETEPLSFPERIERAGEEVTFRAERGEDISITQRGLGFGASFFAPIVAFPGAVLGFGKALITEPITTIKGIPGGIGRAGAEFGRLLESPTPERAFGRLAGDIILFKGLGRAGRFAGDIASQVRTRLGDFREIRGGQIRDVPFTTGLRDIPILRSAPSLSFAEQVRLAGTIRPLIATAQTGLLGKFFKRSLQLERTLFFDPFGRVRTSRFKTPKPATLIDILTEDVTFRRPKFQVGFIEETFIEAFPKGFADIIKALTSGRTLTPSQFTRLKEFQTTPTGLPKPIGIPSREAEVILDVGEIFRRRRGLGATLIDRQRVELFIGDIIKGTARTRELLGKGARLSAKETSELAKRLSGETGLGTPSEIARGLISPISPTAPFVSPVGLGVSVVSGIAKFTRSLFPGKTTATISFASSKIPRTIKSVSFGPSPPPRISPVSPVSPLSPISPTRRGGRVSPPVSPQPRAPPIIPISPPPISPPVSLPPFQPPSIIPRAPTGFLPVGFDIDITRLTERPIIRGTGRRKVKAKKKKRKAIRQDIRPSFTALTLDLRGPLPKPVGRLGITPFQIRTVPL